ncbi:MAG: stage V sporulation protein SpoVM [Ruminococcus sp.]|nr:stage V sporulation protein SpoVM [Ruminococcus sp.]
MKIVVVKSPKLLASLFRVIFKMKCEPVEEV